MTPDLSFLPSPTIDLPKLSKPIFTPGNTGPEIGLAVESMKRHMTDEGWQIFAGLEYAGYKLHGYGIGQSLTDVSKIIFQEQPRVVILQDKREWDVEPGNFREPLARFHNVGALKERSDIFKVTILKDSHQRGLYHRESAYEIGCHAWIIYYHPKIVSHLAPWVRPEHLIRTYHSVEPSLCVSSYGRLSTKFDITILSGALGGAYPLRTRLVKEVLTRGRSQIPGCHYIQHPGYNRHQCRTPYFLSELNRAKVAICTASKYNYLLRKIIEAVACGCIPITNLPEWEVVPEIDKALVRIKSDITIPELASIIDALYKTYDVAYRSYYADKAKVFYDWRAVGARLVKDTHNMMENYNALS